MIADRALWIDEKGRLVDGPPASGVKLSGMAGTEIPEHIAKRYHLALEGGKVVQNGKPPAVQPPSTPPAMIADRDLFLGTDGNLAEHGVKIASKGGEVAMHYIREYSLALEGGKVVQKARPKGGLTITQGRG